MVMDFSVANADDFAQLAVGQTLHFEITKNDKKELNVSNTYDFCIKVQGSSIS